MILKFSYKNHNIRKEVYKTRISKYLEKHKIHKCHKEN